LRASSPSARTPATNLASGAVLGFKYKINKAQALVIGGYTPDNPLDALIVAITKAIS
jgi:hypothetical protein